MPGSGTFESGEPAVTTRGRCLSKALKGADSAAGVTLRGWLVAESSCPRPHLGANALAAGVMPGVYRGRILQLTGATQRGALEGTGKLRKGQQAISGTWPHGPARDLVGAPNAAWIRSPSGAAENSAARSPGTGQTMAL